MPSSENPPNEPAVLPDAVTSGRQTPEDVDATFGCLANRRRRLLIESLSETAGPIVIEELVQHVWEREDRRIPGTSSDDRLDEITIALRHNHLPKMDEAGIVEVDHETKAVQEGDRFCTAESLLEVI